MSGSRRARWLALVLALVMVPGSASADVPGGEAWFPSGVGTVTAATYPEGTLHVGAIAGNETDRTYLRFDGLEGEAASAVLTIPVDADAGTSSPETAVVAACAVPGGLDGEPATPPEVDCAGAPVATFVAGDAPALTVDVTSLVAGGTVTVALVPVLDGGTWHIGFDSRERDGGAPADLAVTVDEPEAPTTPTTRSGSVSPSVTSPPAPGGPIAVLPPPSVPVAVGTAIDEVASAPPVPVVTVSVGGSADDGFDYAAVFALPLVLLVLVALLGDGLTRPVRVREETT